VIEHACSDADRRQSGPARMGVGSEEERHWSATSGSLLLDSRDATRSLVAANLARGRSAGDRLTWRVVSS